MRTLIVLSVALAVAAASSVASAVACYTLLDRKDTLVYQNGMPPVDMSDKGNAAREGLRRRNEYLLIADVDSCPPIAAAAGTTGYRPATVDEIVGEMRGYFSFGGVSNASGRMDTVSTGGGSAGAPPAAPAARPASGAAPRY